MNKIIIYGSQYGTTKAYAEKLSEMTGIPVMSYEKVKNLSEYDEVIHFGGLYAGGIKGLKTTLKYLNGSANFVIVTVGLADVTVTENTDSIKKSIAQQVSEEVLNRTKCFHLRGGIDYGKLNFLHKTMMALLYKMITKNPPEQRPLEMEALIETYNKQVSFVDFDSLKPIIEEC